MLTTHTETPQPEHAEATPTAGAPRSAHDTTEPARAPQPVGEGVLQVVHGPRRVGWAAYKLQRNATSLVRTIVKPPYAATETLDTLECLKLSEGVEYQVLYDRTALARAPQQDITSRMIELGEQARVVQHAPTKLLLADNDVALIPLVTSERTVESAVVLRSSSMLTGLGRVFDDLWRAAAPIRPETTHHTGEDKPSEEERWILSLLASGATDETIGRLMGFSARTAHRRVRELVARLGVETRFQAGVQAVKLGWL